MSLPITSISAAILALWLIWLAARVIQMRGSENIMIGDGANDGFIRRSRAHGNLTEYAPIGAYPVGLCRTSGSKLLASCRLCSGISNRSLASWLRF